MKKLTREPAALAAAAHLVHLVLRDHWVGWNTKRAPASSHRHSYLLGYKHTSLLGLFQLRKMCLDDVLPQQNDHVPVTLEEQEQQQLPAVLNG